MVWVYQPWTSAHTCETLKTTAESHPDLLNLNLAGVGGNCKAESGFSNLESSSGYSKGQPGLKIDP